MNAKYSEENLKKIVSESTSIAEVLRKLGLKARGSNYETLKKKLAQYNIDVSHFTGQLWNKGLKYLDRSSLTSLSEILQDNVSYKSYYLKHRLIAEGLKENRCECCGITEWQGKPAPLELHHINGDHYDNRLENLQILCLNCHAQTDTFRKRHSARKGKGVPKVLSDEHKQKIKNCPICKKEFTPDRVTRKFCSRKCYITSLKNEKNITFTTSLKKEDIEKVIMEYNNITDMSKHFNISRTTMRKLLDMYGLLEEFKKKFDFRSKSIIQCDLNWNEIKIWGSIADAECSLGIKGISKCLAFKQASCGGYKWKYKS